MNIQQLESDLSKVQTQAKNLLERTMAQCSNSTPPRGMTETERANIQNLLDEGKAIKAKIDRETGDAAMTAAIENLSAGLRPTSSTNGGGPVGPSIGQQFVTNPEYQQFIRYGGHRSSGAWTSPALELSATTLTEGVGSGGALVLPHNLPGIRETPTRRLTVADLFANGTTDSNLITFMRETTFTNAAAAVAEGGTKPESTLVFEAATSPTQKIAHWIPTTTEILEDQPLVATYVDGRLRHGVELKLEDALINGSGVSPILEGILARTGLTAAQARGAMTNADAIAAQVAAIETATLLPVDAIVIHPANWLAIQLLKAADGTYLSGSGPIGPAAPPMLWGRHVAVSPVIAQGTALVGCFRTAAQLFYRTGIKVTSTNSHADFFTTNKIAILAEVRVNLVTFRNAGFGIVTGLTS